jgi:hypothetical protein
MSTLLYPPNGGEPVLAHATQVERMKSKGWLETARTTGKKAKPTKTKAKVKENGES